MSYRILILALLAVATIPAADTPAAEHTALSDSTTALLIIDVQDFYFPGGAQPLHRPEAASANAGRLLAAFRSHGRLVVHVGHQVRAGGDFHPDVAPLPSELVVMKSEVNSFQGTELLKHLREAGIGRLVVCGMQTHMCLEGAVRAAADHGFQCVVVGDACATRDLTRNEVVVPAVGVHQTTLATLDGIYAEVMSADVFLGDE
jgi:nicotinamidase-related amidase